MPRLYMSDYEAALLVVLLEKHMDKYADSFTVSLAEALNNRIRTCIEMQGQGKRKALTPKGER